MGKLFMLESQQEHTNGLIHGNIKRTNKNACKCCSHHHTHMHIYVHTYKHTHININAHTHINTHTSLVHLTNVL